MSYKQFITEIKSRDDLTDQIAVSVVKCPFCDVEYAGKSDKALSCLMAEHISSNHRSGMLTIIKNHFDIDQILIDNFAEKAIKPYKNKMPADLWAEMPDIVCLTDESDK